MDSSEFVLLSENVDWPYPDVVSQFDLMVSRHGDEQALRCGEAHMDYRRLDALSDRVAGELAARGVATGDCVGLSGPYGIHTAVALLGILKAGAHYAHLSETASEQQRRQMVSRLDIRQALSSGGRMPSLEALDLPCLVVADLPDEGPGRPAVASDPDATAYVIFSSGSTGKPKAIACCHCGITRLCMDQPMLGLDASTVMLVNSPLSFDLSTLEIWGPLLTGGQCVFHEEALLTPAGLRGLIREQGVNTLWLTSAFFNTMVDLDAGCMQGARAVLAGGDVLSVAHMRRAMQANPDVAFINGYGPTENTTFTTCHRITAADLDRPSLPIGLPINGTGVVICDASLTPLPAGEMGELVTFGVGLARGYLGAPVLDAEKFRSIEIGGVRRRVYLTGDLARLGEDGLLEFHGRRDKEVKINGFRVDLAELEDYFRGSPLVRDCALMDVERQGGKQLLAAIVPAGELYGDTLDVIQAQMVAPLPRHLRPHALFATARLPLTANGKLDRSALLEQWQADAIDLAGLSALERGCAALWQRHTGRTPSSRRSDFFAAGGNSLLALRLVGDAARLLALDRPLPVVEFYGASRFDEFCRWLAGHTDEPAGAVRVGSDLSKVAWAGPRNLAQFQGEAKQDGVGFTTQSCLVRIRPAERDEPVSADEIEAELSRRFPAEMDVRLDQYRGELISTGDTALLDDGRRSWLARHHREVVRIMAGREFSVELNPYQRSMALDELFNGNLDGNSLFYRLLPTTPYSDDQLRRASVTLHRRYPLLNARVRLDGERFMFALDESVPVPDLLCDDGHPDDGDFCRHYLHLRHSVFEHGYLALVRSTTAGEPAFGVWLHHIAADAPFSNRLLSELRAELEGGGTPGEADLSFVQQNWHIAHRLRWERPDARRHWAALQPRFSKVATQLSLKCQDGVELVERDYASLAQGRLLAWAIGRKQGLMSVFAVLLGDACNQVLGWRPQMMLAVCTQRNRGISADGSGCYVNLLPLLLDGMGSASSVDEAIEVANRVVQGAMAASSLPYEEISEACGGLRGKDHVLINIVEDSPGRSRDWAVSYGLTKVRRPLTLTVSLRGGRLARLALAGRFEPAQLEGLTDDIERAIERLLEKDSSDAMRDLAVA